ncbi:ComF family protein [Falsochrobactrum sp. TDYN1]|uniref:ComF family protein n=1 Tax=Falsochrobactrum tianjinense TaxID=2706015 RepID=A0A949PKI4_9HYPH|nr:ComF family protein [Falsochrobactrum sp. TDYN1]MBV2141889.1 ComF family protein [Falsochrobactrum sp. TDYN1]
MADDDRPHESFLRSFGTKALDAMQGGLRSGANLLFPAACIGCRMQVSEPGTLCPQCWSQLRFIEKPYCPVLGIPFNHDFGENFMSAEAIADPPPFRRLRSAVLHRGAAQRMAVSLKFHDRTDLAPWMARWMQRAGRELIDDCDVVVPVPLHRWRMWQRRFNQSAELARALTRLNAKPFAPEALKRVRRTQQQIGLGLKERRRNVDGAFRVPKESEILVRGCRVLLVDDVYTTGATVKAATRALLRTGATSVDVLTFSRVLPET